MPTTTAVANAFGSNCGGTQSIFNRCISDLLYSGLTGQYHASIESFCTPQQPLGNGPRYHCLCEEAKKIIVCYNTNCPSDSSFQTALTTQTSYCQAADQYPKPTVAVAQTVSYPSNDADPTLAIPGPGGNGAAKSEGNHVSFGLGDGAVIAALALFIYFL
ncbi:hypothetical protein BDR26DRAFT_1004788 [Obelidium mucronatum]|nr:hypothetical protein BDR26DRAFT_1004788 [Obelidium mucronatum]